MVYRRDKVRRGTQSFAGLDLLGERAMAKDKHMDAEKGRRNQDRKPQALNPVAGASLGDQATFAKLVDDARPQSLGDTATLHGRFGTENAEEIADLGIEVVDLESRYKVERELGRGGMGEVLLATDMRLNRKVAIKRMLGDMVRSPLAVKRFLTEAQSIAALNHPNIVQIYDYGRAADGPFLIMEHVEGPSLLERCASGPIPVDESIRIVSQLCDGLAKAHAMGIIHRDIKPANVLLTNDGIPKLTDFGLAKGAGDVSTATVAGVVLGTIDFMPPEQRRDATQVDARSDLWSLAATLYQMITGESPKVIRINKVPRGLQDVIDKALEESKEARYQSAVELREALHASRTTAERSGMSSVELGIGECVQCRAANETSRKFCRECATPLRIECLRCKHELPVWEKVCGDCGALQRELVHERQEEMRRKSQAAEEKLRSFDFQGARYLVDGIQSERDARLQHLRSWAEAFRSEIESVRAQQLQRAEALMVEALKHEAACDYRSGVKALEHIPPSFRDESLTSHPGTVAGVLKRLEEKRDRAEQLEQEIHKRIAARELKELLPMVEELHALVPSRLDVQKLQGQLIQRTASLKASRDHLLDEARREYAAQNYNACLHALKRIDAEVIDDQVRSFQAQVEGVRQRARELGAQIQSSIKLQQFAGLLPFVEEYLQLRASDREAEKIRDQLIAWQSKQVEASRLAAARNRDLRIALAVGGTIGAFLVLASLGWVVISWIRSVGTEAVPVVVQEEKKPTPSESVAKNESSGPVPVVVKPESEKADEILKLSPIRNSLGMELKILPPGTFNMGSERGFDDERPVRKIRLTQPFAIGVYEVTQEQYQRVIGRNPSGFKGAKKPVDNVSWNDAREFCRRLSELSAEKAAGRVYRLPTEAEWEYACRAGSQAEYTFGDQEAELKVYAWYGENSGRQTAEVGRKRPNAWGLYDMHGNVWEWCQDLYGSYPSGAASDPQGPTAGSRRVLRGGNWLTVATVCRSAFRNRYSPSDRDGHRGFRIVAVSSEISGL